MSAHTDTQTHTQKHILSDWGVCASHWLNLSMSSLSGSLGVCAWQPHGFGWPASLSTSANMWHGTEHMDMDMDSIVNMDAVEEIHRLTDTQTSSICLKSKILHIL